MVNFYERVLQHPQFYRQFTCGQSLITAFNCPMEARLMKTRFADLWTQHNYLFYVIGGQKTWHTAQGAYDIQTGSCVFVRKGGFILEQMEETGFCVLLFFIPDDFIAETLQSRAKPISGEIVHYEPVMLLNSSDTLAGFFLSMSAYFSESLEPDPALLEIKFKELVLTVASNPANKQLLSYFGSLLHDPQDVVLRRVMEDNFCYNMKLEVYASLSNRSLSAFKRDFEKLFHETPGKWLLHKRLVHATHLLQKSNKTMAETAFECGFESPSHFSRAFKQKFGKTPLALRQAVKNPG